MPKRCHVLFELPLIRKFDDYRQGTLSNHFLFLVAAYEQRVIYQQEDVFENFEEVMESGLAVQIFADVKEVEKLLDVDLRLDGDGQLLAPDWRGQTRAIKSLI